MIRYGRESERGLLADARIDVPVLDWYKEAALFTGIPVARRGALRPPAGRLSEERISP